MNGRSWKTHTTNSVFLPYDKTPEVAQVEITLGRNPTKAIPAKTKHFSRSMASTPTALPPAPAPKNPNPMLKHLEQFVEAAEKARLGSTYETAHARLALQCIQTSYLRIGMQKDGLIKPLPPASQQPADKMFVDTAERLFKGLETVMNSQKGSADPLKKTLSELWTRSSVPKPH
jgi:hypothetical protein